MIEHDRTLCIDLFDKPFTALFQRESTNDETIKTSDQLSLSSSSNAEDNPLEHLTQKFRDMTFLNINQEEGVGASFFPPEKTIHDQQDNLVCVRKGETENTETLYANHLKPTYGSFKPEHTGNDRHNKCTYDQKISNGGDTSKNLKSQVACESSEHKSKLYMNLQKKILSKMQLTLDGIASELS